MVTIHTLRPLYDASGDMRSRSPGEAIEAFLTTAHRQRDAARRKLKAIEAQIEAAEAMRCGVDLVA